VVAALSFEIVSTSSSYSSAGTSSSPSSSYASPILGVARGLEGEGSAVFSFPLDCIGGDEDRERGKEEAREGEVAGEGALLELATSIVVGLN
jgi:hypothetical protein